jgi:hypothetical protein
MNLSDSRPPRRVKRPGHRTPMIFRLLAAALFAAVAPLAAQTVTLTYLGNRNIATGTLVGGIEFGGVSGISYNPYTDRFTAITDDSRSAGRSRLWKINLSYDETTFSAATVISDLQLRTAAGAILPLADTEGIAGNLDGSFMVSHEGLAAGTDAVNSIPPWIRRFDPVTGRHNGEIPLPDKFIPRNSSGQLVAPDNAAQVSGVRSNLGIENLGISPSRRTLYAANEAALKQDDSRTFNSSDTQAQNSDLRIVRYSGLPGNPVASGEKVYRADQGTLYLIVRRFNTVAEILPIDDNGRLLVLERGLTQNNTNTGSYRIRIYLVDFNQAGTTDVSATPSLIGASFTRLSKTLLWESSSNLDNVEAMCWGRDINGFRTLVLASDNNFASTQVTQFHVLLTNIPAVPRHTLITAVTGSGSVDSSPQLPWYPDGAEVSLTVVPATHYDFGRWEGDASGSANPLALTMTANRNITARFRSPYQRWKFTYFTEAEIYQSQMTWPEEDPDNDGITNLMEYALGGDPTQPNTAVLPVADHSAGALTFDYVKNPTLPDVSWQVQASPNLVDWHSEGLPGEGGRLRTPAGTYGSSESSAIRPVVNDASLVMTENKTHYFSALMRTSGGGYAALEMRDNSLARAGFGITSTNAYFLNIGGSQVVTTSNSYTPNTTMWLVAKVTTFSATNDTIQLSWFAPGTANAASEPTTWSFSHSFNNASTVSSNLLQLRTSPNTTAEIDEIRIGPNWESVTTGIGSIVSESFAYPSGSLVANNGGTGFTSAWSGSNPGLVEGTSSLLYPIGDFLMAMDNGNEIRRASIPMMPARAFLRLQVKKLF